MDELLLSELDEKIVACLSSSHSHVRAASANAVVHLKKAWRLRELDRDMAVFRGITAEEEAATAIIVCLQELRYRNAEKLRRRDHVHKLSVYPFFMMINNHFAGLTPQPEVRFRVKEAETEHPQLTIQIKTPAGWAEPIPPLNFAIFEDRKEGPRYDFRREIQGFLEHNGLADYRVHLKQVAQLRNQLLYANYEGRPEVVGDVSPQLLVMRDHVFALLRALCLIFPQRDHGLFVQQALDAFLAAVEGIDYETLVQS